MLHQIFLNLKILFNKKINLGLDLQGGSYLLLEIDNAPVIEQKLQNTSVLIRNFFKEKNIRLSNFKISNDEISFSVNDDDKQIILDELNNEESTINPYYPRFKSHQLEINEIENVFSIKYSKA